MCNQPVFRRPHLRPDTPIKPPTLDFYMPATPPLILLATIEFWLKILLRRHHFRRLFKPLLEENDLILADIGLERTDIEWALVLPLKVDALKALAACCKARGAVPGADAHISRADCPRPPDLIPPSSSTN